VSEDAVANLLGEIQRLGDPQRLLVVAEPPVEARLEGCVQGVLARVAERRMAGVVPEADRLDEVFVQTERLECRIRSRSR
jgi:hypothetical protein